MKKQIAVLTLAFAASLPVLFTSCHDDIYYDINQEVAVESKGIVGSINALVRFGDYVYLQNGKVYRKDISKSSSNTGLYNEQWEKVVDTTDSTSPLYNYYIANLASDQNNIYAYAVTWYNADSGEKQISTKDIFYSTDGKAWTKISLDTLNTLLGASDTTGKTDIMSIFCNRAYNASDRNAYARLYSTTDSAYHVYKLDGGNTPTLVSDGTNGASSSSITAAHYKGSDYFSNYHAFAANDDYIYYAKDADDDAVGSSLFYANQWDSTNGYTLNGTATGYDESAGTIYEIGITADYLLLGTSAGIAHVALTANVPAAATSTFTNNAASTLSSSYYIYELFVRDPSINEYDNDLYGTTEHVGSYSSSTSALANDVGLWAYYPERGTWNKDGTSDDASSGN